MASKNFLDSLFHVFSKWNFFKSHKSKIHPTSEERYQRPGDNSSTESDNDQQAVALWQDFIEEYDCLLMETKGQKAKMYLLENRPLIHEVVTGASLHSITDELIQTYGLQMLNIVLDVICDPTVNRNKDTLESILRRMEQLDYAKSAGHKLIVWIEDFPLLESGDCGDTLARLTMTEVMQRRIEPQMVIPCHNMDRKVMNIIKNIMKKDLLATKEQDGLLDDYYETSMYLIALRIALASENCNFILIDANQLLIDTSVFRDLTEFATTLGHEVMFLRYAPNANKKLVVNEFATNVEDWVRANNKSLYIDNGTVYLEDEPSSELVVPRQGAEILHKLTRFHFKRKPCKVVAENNKSANDDDKIRGSGESEISESDSDSEDFNGGMRKQGSDSYLGYGAQHADLDDYCYDV